MFKVTVMLNKTEKETFSLYEETTVHDFLSLHGLHHSAPCGGNGLCKKCKIKASGNLSLMEKSESEFLSDDEILKGIRLACCAVIKGDATIYLHGEDFGMTYFESISPSNMGDRQTGYGIAFDIGTTTVAAYLFDLQSKEQLFCLSEENRQRMFGDDVISRISACKIPANLNRLNRFIVNQMNSIAENLCRKAGISLSDLTLITVAGNTTMMHLLANLDPAGIAVAPFEPTSLFGNIYRGEQLGLNAKCDVYILPCVSAYVGGDITAGFCACDFDITEKTALLIDIGTNGEMGLVKNGEIYCCSTAAGPAFEGANIKYGMPGINGAVSHIKYSGGEYKFEILGDSPAKGICGSGLVDGVACLLKNKVIDETGFMEEDFKLFATSDVAITPKDIREVQLAKSAICSGVHRLMDLAGVKPDEIESVYLAGGFGTYIDPLSATETGLIPKELAYKCKGVGNTSGKGASMALISEEYLLRIEKIPQKCIYHELSGDGEFDRLFMENMMF